MPYEGPVKKQTTVKYENHAHKIVRELDRDWQPLFGNMQEAPPFDLMREAADNYEGVEFQPDRVFAMPDKAPTGYGLRHPKEDPETGHFVAKTLDSINPSLGTFYRGGHDNEDHHHVEIHNYGKGNARDGALGGRIEFDTKLTMNPKYTTPHSLQEPNHYYPREIFL